MRCARGGLRRGRIYTALVHMSEKPPPSSSSLTSPRNISHLILIYIYVIDVCIYYSPSSSSSSSLTERRKRFVFFLLQDFSSPLKKEAMLQTARREIVSGDTRAKKATACIRRVESSRERRETLYIFQLIADGRTDGRAVICTRRLLLLNIFTHLYVCHISDWRLVSCSFLYCYSWLFLLLLIIIIIIFWYKFCASESGDSQHEATDRPNRPTMSINISHTRKLSLQRPKSDFVLVWYYIPPPTGWSLDNI